MIKSKEYAYKQLREVSKVISEHGVCYKINGMEAGLRLTAIWDIIREIEKDESKKTRHENT